MAYDEGLAERLREFMADDDGVTERKMFGGLCLMLNGNMCCGIVDERLMARVGPDQYADALGLPGASQMDFTGKPLKGMIYVDAETIADDDVLVGWLDRCRKFAGSLPAK